MSKAKPTTKEQVVYFLFNNISLGTYDKRFIENLLTMYVSSLNPVTTNQSNLLDKIIIRYERQLRKEEIDATEMVNLSWTIKPIESSPKYTQAYVDIHDKNLEVRSPFKSEFIKEFKQLPSMNWDKEEKVWSIPFHEVSLNTVLKLVEKHYPNPNYSDEINDILHSLKSFDAEGYWNPTLVKSGNLFYIAATNTYLDEAIKDIELNDSLPTLARLVYHGVDIGKSVVGDITTTITDEDLFFALDREPNIESVPDNIVNKILSVGADYVVLRERTSINKKLAEHIRSNLEPKGIKVEVIDQKSKPSYSDVRSAKLPVMVGGYSFSTPMNVLFAKVIGLVNSNPINIK